MHDNSANRDRDDPPTVGGRSRDLERDVRGTTDVHQATTPLALESVGWTAKSDRRVSI